MTTQTLNSNFLAQPQEPTSATNPSAPLTKTSLEKFKDGVDYVHGCYVQSGRFREPRADVLLCYLQGQFAALKNLSTELDSTITETTDFQNLARTANILYNAFSLNYRGYSSSLIDDTASLPPLVVVPPVAYKYIKEKKILEEVPYTEDDSETSLYMVKPSTSPYPEYIKECIESSFGINSENAPEFQLQIPNKDLQSFFSWFKKKERSFLERFPKVKTATP